jgi:hypothetical protein
VAWWKADSLRPAGVYLLDNLISYWKLDEASGTRNDSQSTNHLAATNAPVGVAGKINNGCQFVTGSSQRLSVASSSALQVTSDFTFSFWLKLNTLAAGNPAVLGKDNTAAPSDYGFYPHATAGLVFWVGDPNLYAVAVGSAPSTGVWYHVVGWYDSSDTKLRLRINDTTTFVSSMTCVLASTAAQFWIGAGNYTGFAQYADCVVDEVGFWKRVLTAAEITALYNGGAGLPYTSFVA